MIPVEGGGSIRCPAPQNVMNMNLPMDTNRNRYEKPAQTPGWGAEVANPNSITFAQKGMTTVVEVGWNLSDMTEPSRCQETAVAAEGAGTGATTNNLDRFMDCIKRNTTGRKLATKGDEYMELIPDQAWPVVSEKAPADGTRVMQYQWNDRESVGMTEMLMPRNYLEIPEPRIPRRPGTLYWWTINHVIRRISSHNEPGWSDRFLSRK